MKYFKKISDSSTAHNSSPLMKKTTYSLRGTAHALSIALILLALDIPYTKAAPFQIAKDFTDPGQTTHAISSGGMTLGVSDLGGGYINQLIIPGKGDTMGFATDKYGRGGQSAIRDRMHGGVYNPTQAGFSDTAGTSCEVIKSADSRKLTITARKCCLWRADGNYDYTRWENFADDGYGTDGGYTDLDLTDEENLSAKQSGEITSDFDYYGEYEDIRGDGSGTIKIACIRHYFEYRFVRDSTAATSPMQQFSKDGQYKIDENGNITTTPVCQPGIGKVTDLSYSNPTGSHPANTSNRNDLSAAIMVMSLRMDIDLWNPSWFHYSDLAGTLTSVARGTEDRQMTVHAEADRGTGSRYARLSSAVQNLITVTPGPSVTTAPLLILSDSSDPNATPAIGLYFPKSAINTQQIVGVKADGSTAYTDDRRVQMDLFDNPLRVAEMHKFGFALDFLGILNPSRVSPTAAYEKLRGECYILYGSPSQIVTNAKRLQAFQ